jgi:hypothetical protein
MLASICTGTRGCAKDPIVQACFWTNLGNQADHLGHEEVMVDAVVCEGCSPGLPGQEGLVLALDLHRHTRLTSEVEKASLPLKES